MCVRLCNTNRLNQMNRRKKNLPNARHSGSETSTKIVTKYRVFASCFGAHKGIPDKWSKTIDGFHAEGEPRHRTIPGTGCA